MMKLFWISKTINKRYKSETRNFLIGITSSSILLLLLIMIISAFGKIYKTMSEDNVEIKEITITDFLKDDFENQQKISISETTIANLNKRLDVEQVVYRKQFKTTAFNVKIDGHVIPIGDTFSAVDVRYETFDKYYIDKANKKGLSNQIIYGRNFNQVDLKKVLVDENFARTIGYENPGNIVGNIITIFNANVMIEQIEIVGVYSYLLGSVPSQLLEYNENDFNNYTLVYGYSSPFILSSDIVLEIGNDQILRENTSVVVDVKSINDVKNVYNFITKQVENHVFSSYEDADKVTQIISNLLVLVFTIVIVLFVLAFISIISNTIAKLLKQKDFLKMLSIMGYSNKQIVFIYVLEMLYVLFKAVILYTGSVFLMSLIIENLLKETYQILSPNLKNVFFLNWSHWLAYSLILIIVSCGIIILITTITLANWNKRRRLY